MYLLIANVKYTFLAHLPLQILVKVSPYFSKITQTRFSKFCWSGLTVKELNQIEKNFCWRWVNTESSYNWHSPIFAGGVEEMPSQYAALVSERKGTHIELGPP